MKSRLLTFALVLAIAWPWLRTGAWPSTVVQQLDHCPQAACDFVLYYLPQIRQLHEAPGVIHRGWVYPPLLAILLQGLGSASTELATRLWIAFNLALAGGLVVLCRRRLRGGLTAWLGAAALVSLSLPVLHALKWGQISLFVGVVGISALLRGGKGGALMVGLLGGIKLYPALYLGVPLVRGRFKELGVGVVAGLGLGIGLPALLLGASATQAFFENLRAFQQVNTAGMGGQALAPTLHRLFEDGRHVGRAPEVLGEAGPLLFGAPAHVLAVVLAGLVVVGTLAAARRASKPAAVALILVGVALVVPPGWHHYFVVLPFAQAVAMGSERRLVQGLGGLSAALCVIPVLALPELPELYFEWSRWGMTTLSALLVWIALLLPAGAGAAASGAAPAEAPT